MFTPKKYWHWPDYSQSGIIGDGTVMPAGVEVSYLFFAAPREMAPVFFSHKSIIKHAVLGDATDDEIFWHHNIAIDKRKSAILFDAEDESAIRSRSISIYEFDSSYFMRVPSGEYVTHDQVRPTAEDRMNSCYDAMCRFGFSVHFARGFKKEMLSVRTDKTKDIQRQPSEAIQLRPRTALTERLNG